VEQRSDSLDGFGRGIYVHTFEFAGFDPAAGLRRFLGFRRLLSSFVIVRRWRHSPSARPSTAPAKL
jgi:hypothetical protein